MHTDTVVATTKKKAACQLTRLTPKNTTRSRHAPANAIAAITPVAPLNVGVAKGTSITTGMTWAPTNEELRVLRRRTADTAERVSVPSTCCQIESAIHLLDPKTWLLIANDDSISTIGCHHSDGAINQALSSVAHECVDVMQGQHAGAITLIVGSERSAIQSNAPAVAYFKNQLPRAALERLRGSVLVTKRHAR